MTGLVLACTLLTLPLLAQGPPRIAGVDQLRVGGQYRLRYEGMFDYDLDRSTASAASNDFFTQRVRLDFDFDVNDDIRAFVQVQDAREWGEESSTTDDDADGFDLHQGYVDLSRRLGIGGTTRVGRQEINLGDQRLVGALDWKSQARSLDGILQSWQCDDCSFLLWAIQARELINDNNDDAQFAGVQHSRRFGESVDGDFYLMFLHDDGLGAGQTQERFTLGTRWVGNCCEQLEFGLELATQFGEQSGMDVPFGETYAGHVHARYEFGCGWRPRVTVALDAASGNDPTTADNERFANLFPTAHAHWGMMDLAQWENLFNPWARLQVSPCSDSDVSLTWLHLEAMESGDAFRGPAATLSNGNPSFSETMGEEIDLLWTRRLDWDEDTTTSVQIGYGLFLPGSGAKSAAGSDDPAHFLYAQFDLKF